MSMSQVDPTLQTHVASHTPQEMKMWDCKDDNEEDILISQEMDDQPSRGEKRDEEDDRKTTAKQTSLKMTMRIKTTKSPYDQVTVKDN